MQLSYIDQHNVLVNLDLLLPDESINEDLSRAKVRGILHTELRVAVTEAMKVLPEHSTGEDCEWFKCNGCGKQKLRTKKHG